jgi:hypothetical protein
MNEKKKRAGARRTPSELAAEFLRFFSDIYSGRPKIN